MSQCENFYTSISKVELVKSIPSSASVGCSHFGLDVGLGSAGRGAALLYIKGFHVS